MADFREEMSDGSDIEVEVDVENVDQEVGEPEIPDPLDRVQLMFDDSDDEEFDGFHADWTTNPENFRPVHPTRYQGPSGPQVQHREDARPLEYFQDFWTDDLWDQLVLETNR
jgi:hypothetical protein